MGYMKEGLLHIKVDYISRPAVIAEQSEDIRKVELKSWAGFQLNKSVLTVMN